MHKKIVMEILRMKKKLRINRFIIIAVLIYFIYTLVSQQQTLNSYKQEASTYSNQIEEANDKNEELKNVKNNINSTEYIENMAREKLGMYLPNERVYIDITN
jgi:cell division protein DivIC